jgi:hypothetical protein
VVQVTLPADSNDLIREQSYLIARGVRALALLGHCTNEPVEMLRRATLLDSLAEPGAIPFVIDRGDGFADWGFAAAQWVLDLYSWLTKKTAQDAVPQQQVARILGLLLGYSTDAIRQFEENRSGRLFTASPLPASNSRPDGSRCTEETAPQH